MYIPQACRRAELYGDKDDPILLTFDGYGSHLTDALCTEAIANKIHFFKLRAHTTHKTQPCDVGCFGPMSKKWLERMEEIVVQTGEGLQKHAFVDEYMAVRSASITKESVVAAFRKTGIHPFNPDIFTKEDFAPSCVSSTKSNMPASYPASQSPPDDITERARTGFEDNVTDEIDRLAAMEALQNPNHDVPSVGEEEPQHWFFDADDELPMDSTPSQQLPTSFPPLPSSASSLTSIPPSTPSPAAGSLPTTSTTTTVSELPSGQPPSMPVTVSPIVQPPSTPAALPIAEMPIAQSPSTNWGSKVPQFKRSVPDTTWSETDEIQALKRDLRRLEDLYLVEFTSRQKLEMHADLTRLENKQLKTQLNLRQERADGRKGKQFQSAADFMMSTDSLAAWEESKAERAEKERVETEKAAVKAAMEKDNEVRRGRLMHDSDIRY